MSVDFLSVTEDDRAVARVKVAGAIAASPNRDAILGALAEYLIVNAATLERRKLQGHDEAVLRYAMVCREIDSIGQAAFTLGTLTEFTNP